MDLTTTLAKLLPSRFRRKIVYIRCSNETLPSNEFPFTDFESKLNSFLRELAHEKCEVKYAISNSKPTVLDSITNVGFIDSGFSVSDLHRLLQQNLEGIGVHFQIGKRVFRPLEQAYRTQTVICTEVFSFDLSTSSQYLQHQFWAVSTSSQCIQLERIIGINAYLYDLILGKDPPSNGGVPIPRRLGVQSRAVSQNR